MSRLCDCVFDFFDICGVQCSVKVETFNSWDFNTEDIVPIDRDDEGSK